jgi:hypothetical protein
MAAQAWALLGESRHSRSPAEVGSPVAAEGAALDWWNDIAVRMPSGLDRFDTYVGALWLAASLVLLVGLIGGFWRLHRRALRWPRRYLAGREVLVSEDFGPALVGVISPRIVLPRSLVEQSADALALVCLHEAEHRKTRDAWLLAGAAFTVAVLPWNAALWWQLMRLRAAIELDCDKRVVDDGALPARYAGLLLDLGAGTEHISVAVPAFLQPPTLLERRLTMLISGVRRKGPVATLASTAATVLLTVAACQTSAPALDREPTIEIAADGSAQPGFPHMERIRGMADAYLLFVDGERVDVPDARAALAAMDPNDIESIEIIKGPAAANLYGADAMGGVITIIMKQ